MKEKDFLGSPSNPSTDSASLFMLNCTLFTREQATPCGAAPGDAIPEQAEPGQTDSAQTDTPFDAKIDRYLNGLLAAFSRPPCIEDLVLRLADHDLEMFRRFVRSESASLRYKIYKTERDFLLMSVGRFGPRGREALPAGPEFKHGNQGQMGKNPGYYHFTFSYCAAEPRTSGKLAEIYKQLAMGFQKYSTILTYSAGMYYDLGERLAEAEFYNLSRSTDATRKRLVLEIKRNEFLDAYLAWKREHTEAAKRRMQLVADDLRTLDPGFTFRPE